MTALCLRILQAALVYVNTLGCGRNFHPLLFQVLHEVRHGDGEFAVRLLGAREICDLAPREDNRRVPGSDEERVTGLEHLLHPLGCPHAVLAFQHVAHVGRLALIVRCALKEKRGVQVGQVGFHADGPAIDFVRISVKHPRYGLVR
jgi:hypothetical protein